MRVQAGYPVRIVLDLGHQSMAWLRSLEEGVPLSRIDLAAGPTVEARQRVTPLTVWGRTRSCLMIPQVRSDIKAAGVFSAAVKK